MHLRSVQAWESALSYPNAKSLQALIASYLESGGFAPGREAAEAEALWASAQREAPRLRPPFDAAWFAKLRGEPAAILTTGDERRLTNTENGAVARGLTDALRSQDWAEAPDSLGFVGRAQEIAILRHWTLEERSRLVAVLGMGGIGKTMLAVRLARDLAPAFDRVCWRSLRHVPSLVEWSAGVIGFLSEQEVVPPETEGACVSLLLELLRKRRSLLILDNFESLLRPGGTDGAYRDGAEGYGELLRVLGASEHRSCLIVTSRESPPELAEFGGEGVAVRALQLGGLGMMEGQTLLRDKQLQGDEAAWSTLVEHYGGNCLALRLVGESIQQVFGGEIASFLDQTGSGPGSVFGGIRRLLDGQIQRLSMLEQDVLQSLALACEPLTFGDLVVDLGPRVGRGPVVEAVEGLRRHSLIEHSGLAGAFTPQSVVLEYVTDHLVERACDEIEQGQLGLVVSCPLLKAQAREYVRQSQARLFMVPLREMLIARCGSPAAATQRLLDLLDQHRVLPLEQQGFGPGT